jgi:hypothetical protein
MPLTSSSQILSQVLASLFSISLTHPDIEIFEKIKGEFIKARMD